MITKQEAIALLSNQDRWEPEEYGDSWESQEEIEQMRVFLKEAFDRRFELTWDEPIETPCGWLFPLKFYPLNLDLILNGPLRDHGWCLVDLWTGQVIQYEGLRRSGVRPTEAILRVYIDRLPQEQREQALVRWHLLPYEPIRFYPPFLRFDTPEWEQVPEHTVVMEIDPAFFTQNRLSLPSLIVLEMVYTGPGEEDKRLHPKDFNYFIESTDALRITREWSHGGLMYREYHFALPARQWRYGMDFRLKFSHVPPDQTEWVTKNYLWYGPELCFPWDPVGSGAYFNPVSKPY